MPGVVCPVVLELVYVSTYFMFLLVLEVYSNAHYFYNKKQGTYLFWQNVERSAVCLFFCFCYQFSILCNFSINIEGSNSQPLEFGQVLLPGIPNLHHVNENHKFDEMWCSGKHDFRKNDLYKNINFLREKKALSIFRWVYSVCIDSVIGRVWGLESSVYKIKPPGTWPAFTFDVQRSRLQLGSFLILL